MPDTYMVYLWEDDGLEPMVLAFCPDQGVFARGESIDDAVRTMKQKVAESVAEYGDQGEPGVIIEEIGVDIDE
tara:strand:+ start:532 stop:750 length:219 start_codon:yes stop_codon:yes gene_type:complete